MMLLAHSGPLIYSILLFGSLRETPQLFGFILNGMKILWISVSLLVAVPADGQSFKCYATNRSPWWGTGVEYDWSNNFGFPSGRGTWGSRYNCRAEEARLNAATTTPPPPPPYRPPPPPRSCTTGASGAPCQNGGTATGALPYPYGGVASYCGCNCVNTGYIGSNCEATTTLTSTTGTDTSTTKTVTSTTATSTTTTTDTRQPTPRPPIPRPPTPPPPTPPPPTPPLPLPH